jgi:hypothetical protein
VNIGIVVAGVLFLIEVVSIVIYLLCYRREKYIKQIIKHDCLIYDKSISLEEYFFKQTGQVGIMLEQKDVNETQNIQVDVNKKHTSEQVTNENQLANSIELVQLPENEFNCNNKDFANKPHTLSIKDNIYNSQEICDNLENLKSDPISKDTLIQANNNFFDGQEINIIPIIEYLGTNLISEIESDTLARVKVINPLLKQITIKDYEFLSVEDSMKYNKRTFFKYLWDGLVHRHRLISIFSKHSIVDPFYLRLSRFMFDISLIFGLNAMTYSDSYIELRALSTDKVFSYIT